MVKRTARSVTAVFNAHDALSEGKAKTIEELGLAARPLLKRVGRRDYRPAALLALINAGLIMTTKDGKLYLEESRLSGAKWAKPGIS